MLAVTSNGLLYMSKRFDEDGAAVVAKVLTGGWIARRSEA
jgi:hypothetical protein